MAERQRRTAISIIEEIQKRIQVARDDLAESDSHRATLVGQINTLTALLETVDGEPTPKADTPPAGKD